MNFCTLFLFVYLVTRLGVLLINNLEKMSILGLGALTYILFYSILQLQCKDSYRCLFWLVVFACLVEN